MGDVGSVDVASLSHAQRLDALVGLERLRGWAEAQQQRLLAALAPPGDEPGDKQWVREEIACALRLSPVTVNGRLQLAQMLSERLPATLAMLETGQLTMRHAACLADEAARLPADRMPALEARVLARAGAQTVAEFRRSVRRAVLAADPAGTEARHARAVAERRVCHRDVGDGMGELWALLPLDGLACLITSLDATAAATKTPGDRRTADQRRADALISLAESPVAAGTGDERPSLRRQGTWQGRRPAVQVTIAATTLAGVDDLPAELDGYGPIPAAMARRIAADPSGTWRRLVTDPLGRLLDYGRTTYRPPQDLTDHLIARDRVCRFPGCNRPARRCHIDHQQPWTDAGTTGPTNCECLCPRHHHLKHEAGWRITGDPNDTLTWITPTGHRYRAPPATYDAE